MTRVNALHAGYKLSRSRSDIIMFHSFFFLQKIWFNISCKLSLKYHTLFSRKTKNYINLSAAECFQRVQKVKLESKINLSLCTRPHHGETYYSHICPDLTALSGHGKCSSIFRYDSFKMNIYTFRGGNAVKTVMPALGKGSTLKGKNLLPLGANSFLLE